MYLQPIEIDKFFAQGASIVSTVHLTTHPKGAYIDFYSMNEAHLIASYEPANPAALAVLQGQINRDPAKWCEGAIREYFEQRKFTY